MKSIKYAYLASSLVLLITGCGNSTAVEPPAESEWVLRQPTQALSAEWQDPFVSQVLMADLDGGGRGEILMLTRTSGEPDEKARLSVLRYDGGEKFTPLTQITAMADPIEMGVARLDPDAVLDLVVVGYFDNGFYVFKGQGDGTFHEPDFYPLPGHGNELQIDDVDQDGDADILVTTGGSGQPIVIQEFLGQGDGGFELAGAYESGINAAVSEFQLCDLDGDSKKEAVFSVNFAGAALFYLPALGNGEFGETQVVFAPLDQEVSGLGAALRCLDLNADGRPDLVVTLNYFGDLASDLLSFENLGQGAFAAPEKIVEGDFLFQGGIETADLDVDQNWGLFVAESSRVGLIGRNADKSLSLPEWIASTGEDAPVKLPDGFESLSLAVGDIDGDLYQDIVVGSTQHGVMLIQHQPTSMP